MQIGPLGPDKARARLGEIQARIRSLSPQTAFPEVRAYGLTGEIGGNDFAPLSPFGAGAQVRLTEPPAELRGMIRRAAESAGIEPMLLEAVVAQESGFNPNARSPKGAMGLAQLMPGTARALGVSDPFDPEQNLNGGARYLAQMLTQFGELPLALAAYNAGPGNVSRYGGIPPFAETQNYVERVMARYEALRTSVGGGARL